MLKKRFAASLVAGAMTLALINCATSSSIPELPVDQSTTSSSEGCSCDPTYIDCVNATGGDTTQVCNCYCLFQACIEQCGCTGSSGVEGVENCAPCQSQTVNCG